MIVSSGNFTVFGGYKQCIPFVANLEIIDSVKRIGIRKSIYPKKF